MLVVMQGLSENIYVKIVSTSQFWFIKYIDKSERLGKENVKPETF
jgi:hypothetical protein